jgi:hypothetical protein
MKPKTEDIKEMEVQGIDVIDLGDTSEETRQWNPIQQILDSCCTFTWFGAV